MLLNLHVKNLALIDEIEVDFSEGLNIMTGETGAGKSIILGSVLLALGAKYNRDILRENTSYGFVELTFRVEEGCRQRLLALDVIPEEDEVILSRRLMENRSTCRINGETVTMNTLKEAAHILMDMHGQHEHQSLMEKKYQLKITDDYGQEPVRAAKEQVRDAYRKYRKLLTESEEAGMDEREREKELAFLAFEISEIEKAKLVPGEDSDLETEYRRMSNAKNLAADAAEAYSYTGDMGQENASELISRAIRALSDASRLDDQAVKLTEQLSELDGLLNDFNRELSDYQESLTFSEEEFRETEERLDLINRMKSRYGSTIESILSSLEEKRERQTVLLDYDEYLAGLHRELSEAKEVLAKRSDELTVLRKKTAAKLSSEIEAALQDLNFQEVSFDIRVSPLPDFTAEGVDEVIFYASMNPGQPSRPLASAASGGELSRTMLAIKSVMASKDDTPTLIFDEIDTGISGRTAQKVSEKMALIAKDHQVICITHLAQIAAMADAHYLIEKHVEDQDTKTGIRKLGRDEMVTELARILGGAKITDAVLENAKEMKKLACEYKRLSF